MRILAACSLGGLGHFNPLVPFLDAAARRGDEALVVAPPAMRDVVESAGYTFRPGGQPSELAVDAARVHLPGTLGDEPALLGMRDQFETIATRAMLLPMDAIVADFAPQVILREPWEYSSAIVGFKRKIPAAQVAISLAANEFGAIDAAAGRLSGIRGNLARDLKAAPYLSRLPASLDGSPFAATVRFHDSVPTDDPLPDYWAGSTAPLVYVTFGTVLSEMAVARSVYQLALRAVNGLDARVLLTVGRGFDPAALGGVPPNVRIERWVDQTSVFGQAALVLCHGGAGTVFGALAAGVPVVAVPLFADHFDNGRAVANAGAGIVVEGEPAAGAGDRRVIGAEGRPRVAEAIASVLATPSYQQEAARIAAEMAATPTADEILERLSGLSSS